MNLRPDRPIGYADLANGLSRFAHQRPCGGDNTAQPRTTFRLGEVSEALHYQTEGQTRGIDARPFLK